MDHRFRKIVDLVGEIKMRILPDGFEALLKTIVSQQLSVAAAESIWIKIVNSGFNTEIKVLKATEMELRELGLSKPKIIYAKALAKADLDYNQLREMSDANVVQELTKVKGIGVWTAECYALFSLQRADVFASGDLALQEAVKMGFGFNDRPSEIEMRKICEAWRPWRSIASILLWKYYGLIKKRRGVI